VESGEGHIFFSYWKGEGQKKIGQIFLYIWYKSKGTWERVTDISILLLEEDHYISVTPFTIYTPISDKSLTLTFVLFYRHSWPFNIYQPWERRQYYCIVWWLTMRNDSLKTLNCRHSSLSLLTLCTGTAAIVTFMICPHLIPFCWLVGSSGSWLVSWSVGRLFGRLVVWWLCWLAGLLVWLFGGFVCLLVWLDWLTACWFFGLLIWVVGWLVCWLAGWFVDWLAGWLFFFCVSCFFLVVWLFGWMVAWWVCCLIGWWAGWWLSWLVGWSVHRSIHWLVVYNSYKMLRHGVSYL